MLINESRFTAPSFIANIKQGEIQTNTKNWVTKLGHVKILTDIENSLIIEVNEIKNLRFFKTIEWSS